MIDNNVYLHLKKEDPYFACFNVYTKLYIARSSTKPDVEGLVARLHHRVSSPQRNHNFIPIVMSLINELKDNI